MIIFESLLASFEGIVIFEAAESVSKIAFSLKPNLPHQICKKPFRRVHFSAVCSTIQHLDHLLK
jgi:hypothetical protein